MIKLVVFDMAGTTVDEQNLVYKSVLNALTESGMETDLPTVLAFAAGKEKFDAIKSVIAHLNGEEPLESLVAPVFNRFREILKSAYQTAPVQPQAGAETLFQQLHDLGIKVALNTGYDRQTADQLLDRLNWKQKDYIHLVVTADDVERSRPAPDMIHAAMRHFQLNDPKACVKIGDSIIDIEEGFNAGCAYAIGITTGAHTEEQLLSAQPSTVLHRLEALIPYLQSEGVV